MDYGTYTYNVVHVAVKKHELALYEWKRNDL